MIDLNKKLDSLFYQYKKVNIFMIDISISIREKDREIHIFTDEGRLQRPVFCRSNLPTIEDLKEKSFLQLVKEKKIIYLDSYEIENRTIIYIFFYLLLYFLLNFSIRPAVSTKFCLPVKKG